MTDVSNTGTIGTTGLNGTSATPAGQPGGPGAGVLSSNFGNGTDTTNTAEATGGRGGAGGSGYNNTAGGAGGDAGAGGNGGGGGANTQATLNTASSLYSRATATGGGGGNAGLAGTGTPNGKGADGGNGGTATGSADASDTGGRASATANATGGTGGTGQGAGYAGGAGGLVSGTTAKAYGTSAYATASQTGGAGGGGLNGAAGGAGANSTLTNAVSGATQGGYLHLYQTANAGDGGYSEGGAGGKAGVGASSLSFDDRKNPTQAGMVVGRSNATGGQGGGGTTPQTGGGATASDTITGAKAVSSEAGAAGGQGGAAYKNGTGATGGAAQASATATSDTTGTDSAVSRAYAQGGSGGRGGTSGGSGGVGGAPIGASAVAAQAATATGGHAYAYARQIGGNGGRGYKAGYAGGAGGAVSGIAISAHASGYSARAGAVQTGGNGGGGYSGADGGAGADSTLTNAVTGTSAGGGNSYVRLYQNANAGDGGYSRSGTGGAAGNAASSLTFDDTTANPTTPANYVRGTVRATGGNGGGGTGTQAGGTGTGYANITGANGVGAYTRATGGTGGNGYNTADGGAGGLADATAIATSTTNSTANVNASAHAVGGAGGRSGTNSGNGGAGSAPSGAHATATETAATGGRAYAYAVQTGGTGGNAWGAGNTAGAGSSVPGGTTTAHASGYSARAEVVQTGGSGGTGISGANGGAGADSTIVNADLTAATRGGYAKLYQTANAGSGGYSDGGAGGAAGNASSSLTLDDSSSAIHASYLRGTSTANGGDGGGGATAQAGGTGTASAAVTGTNAITSQANATGGNGGAAYQTSSDPAVAGAAGGMVYATATAASTTTSTQAVNASAHATGGTGGRGGTSAAGGDGGAGGAPTGAHAVATQNLGSGNRAYAYAVQSGGSGGRGYKAGYTGGAGGAVSGANTSASASGYSARARVVQNGGAGGAGYSGATGGAGANSHLTNTVTGATAKGGNGSYVKLYQGAYGGDGGYSRAGIGGAAGNASSSLTFNDNTANATHANDVRGNAKASGGTGGGGQTTQTGGTATAYDSTTGAYSVEGYARAAGGTGGKGYGTQNGAAGGTATATAVGVGTATGTANINASAHTLGGTGGGSSGAGGQATGASATATGNSASGGRAYAYVVQQGGTGGRASGAGFTGGAGGGIAADSSVATATGISARARARQIGGYGGGGYSGAYGAAGASSTLTNAVSGSTRGGYLKLYQEAYGGNGGYGAGTLGGAGGVASSSLTFDDTKNATSAGYLRGNVTGDGGSGGGPAATRGDGGAGTATLTVTGAGQVVADATADGGNSGTTAGTGANATASATAISTGAVSTNTANATANATGGTGKTDGTVTSAAAASTAAGQLAQATANASQGAADTITATAATAGAGTVTGLTAVAQGSGGGQVNSVGKADLSGNAFGYNGQSNDAYAFAVGLPSTASISSLLGNNANVDAKLGTAQATVLGEGIGGGYAETYTTGAQEYKSSLDWTLNATGLTDHLIAGLVGSQSFGSGFDSLEFSASVGGTTVVDHTFTSLTAATTYFDDDALDLGSFTQSGSLAVDLNFDLKASIAGDGFAGQFLLGVTGGNGPPVFAAPSSAVVVQNVATAIDGISLSETGNTTSETFTVTLADTSGLLAATGGTSSNGGHTLTISDSLANVNADLATLTDTEASLGTDSITLSATDSLSGVAAQKTINVTANSLPAIAAPASATIGVGKATAISGVSLSESGNTSGETFTVTLSDANGLLSATGAGIGGLGTNSLTIFGSLGQVNSDLATLSDTDSVVPSDAIMLNAIDSLDSQAAQQTIAVTVAAGPVITVPSGAVVGVNQPSPIGGISIAETGAAADETFTVTLSDNDGRLSATGASGTGTASITITGSLADVNTALGTLTDTDATQVTDTITVNASDGFGNDAGSKTVGVTVNGVPGIDAPSSAALVQNRATTISGVNVVENGNTAAPETVTVTLTDTHGVLSATGAAVSGSGTDSLTLNGSFDQVNTALGTLSDTDSIIGSDAITLTATDSFGNVATQKTISIGDTAAPLPVITAPAAATLAVGQAGAIGGISISEAGATDSEMFTVTLSDAHGLLLAVDGGGGAAISSTTGATSLTIGGSLSDVNDALATLSDTDGTPGFETITVNAKDGFNDSAVAQTIDVQVDGLPVIVAAPSSVTLGVGQSGALGVSLDETPNSSGETFSVTLGDSHGRLSTTGAGGTIVGSGTSNLTISGSLGQVQTDLGLLTDTDAITGSDTITVNASDSFGNVATTQMIAVTVNGAPVIAAPSNATLGAGQAGIIGGVSLFESGDTLSPMFTVTLTDTDGDLSATASGGAMLTTPGTNNLAITGILSDVNATLATLTDTDAIAGSDTITLNATDTFGNGATTQTIAVSVSSASPPPVITAPALAYADSVGGEDAQVPIDGVSVEPGAGLPADEPITVTLTDTAGGLGITQVNGAVVASGDPSGDSITLTGDAADINSTLAELVYTGENSIVQIAAICGGATATAQTEIQLPTTGDPGYPVAQPAGVVVTNNNVTIDGFGTPALLVWDQDGIAATGTVYVNLPLIPGNPAVVGFGAFNGDPRDASSMAVGVQQEQYAPIIGNWVKQLTGASDITVDQQSGLGTVTDSAPGQDDTVQLSFNTNNGIGPAVADQRLKVVFNGAGRASSAIGEVAPAGGGGGVGGPGGEDAGGEEGDADGDVHLRTYSGLYYNFQAAGEFVLTRSTVPGDNFQVQARLQPWFNGASVSVMTEVGVAVGSDRVTIGLDRASPVWIDGTPATLTTLGSPTVLSGGMLEQLTSDSWEIALNTGETVTVTDVGSLLNVHTALRLDAPSKSVQGLLGPDSGNPADELALPDGTVLTQPLTYSQLYTTYADAWRITQPASLLDYGLGETTATFTDPNFPGDAVPVSSLPTSVLQTAAQLVAAAGITDPAVAQAAIEDYALTGDPAFITADILHGSVQPALLADPVNPNAVGGIGIAATAPTVTQAASGPTTVDFTIYRTGADTSTAQVVDYAVQTASPGDLGAGFFAGDVLPSGSVTIAAGQTTTTLALAVTGSLGAAPSGTVDVLINDGTAGPPVLAATASVTVANNLPVAGTPAVPEFLDPGGIGTLSQSGAAWILTLGTVPAAPITLDLANGAATGADTLSGIFSTGGSGVGFSALAPVVRLDAGRVLPITLTPTGGTIEATLTFAATEGNGSGYSASLGDQTLTIAGTAEPEAAATINTTSPIDFGDVHLNAVASEPLSITNSASTGAAALDASVGVTSGIIAGGTIDALAPGATNSTGITVGIDTTSAGAKSGSTAIGFRSDAGNGNTSALGARAIDASGDVFRLATGTIAPVSEIVHIGDPGSAALTIANADPADGFSEDLIASLTGATGNVGIAAGGPTDDIAAGATSSALAVGFSTAAAGTISGTATVGLVSDGAGIDTLGTTALGTIAVPVDIVVDNPAQAAFTEVSGPGALIQSGSLATLDLGTVTEGSAAVIAAIGVENAAAGPADDLAGSFVTAGPTAFAATGFANFSGLGAGADANAGTVTLDTGTAGTFSDTITLAATGSNASGYSASLGTETLTVTGTVVPAAQTFTLTTHVDTIGGGNGDDTIVAAARTPSAGDHIDGGGGTNTLELQGAGLFDLRAPTSLTNVQTITAQEGQAAYRNGSEVFPAHNQVIFLRDGLDATVNVGAATINPDDPRPAGITIDGAHNAAVINLASGNDIVVVGDARETVHGGAGDDVIRVTPSTIGATIDGGSGASILQVMGGGAATMGSSITNIAEVFLVPGAGTIDFISNAEAGLIVSDLGTGADTVTAGGAGQTLTGGAGHETFVGATNGPTMFQDTAATFSGDTIQNFASPGSVLDFTDVTYQAGVIEGFTENVGGTAGTLTVSDGTHTASVTLLGNFSAANFNAAADTSGHGTAITFHLVAS